MLRIPQSGMRDVNHPPQSAFDGNENNSEENCVLSIEPQIGRTIDLAPSQRRFASRVTGKPIEPAATYA
jgi:hypothetical protein